MIKHPKIYEDDTGALFLEMNFDFGPIIHCYSYKWSKDTAKHYGKVWTDVLQALENKGFHHVYAAVREDDKRLKHFAAMYGFEDTMEAIIDNEGTFRRLMKCHW